MKKCLLIFLLSLVSPLHADEIQLQIEGNITANTCSVDANSQNMTVDLGQDVSSNFKDIGDTGVWKNFDVTLSQCPSTLTLVTGQFNGQPDSQHPTKFASSGTAQGLALELHDRQDDILIAPKARFSVLINQTDHTADFPMAARYYATSMPVTAGTFSSVVQVTFIYQ